MCAPCIYTCTCLCMCCLKWYMHKYMYIRVCEFLYMSHTCMFVLYFFNTYFRYMYMCSGSLLPIGIMTLTNLCPVLMFMA